MHHCHFQGHLERSIKIQSSYFDKLPLVQRFLFDSNLNYSDDHLSVIKVLGEPGNDKDLSIRSLADASTSLDFPFGDLKGLDNYQ